jgi:hypothetical protein
MTDILMLLDVAILQVSNLASADIVSMVITKIYSLQNAC